MFRRGDLTQPNFFTMKEYRNQSAAVADVEDLAAQGELVNTPPNLNSPYVRIDPPTRFNGAMSKAEISIQLTEGESSMGVTIRRANPGSAWVFTDLDTQIVDGRAVAQTDEGGVFVAGSGFNFGLVIGLVVAGVVILLVAVIVIGTVVYFVARPEKWRSTKSNVKKTQMKMKRSFARQV